MMNFLRKVFITEPMKWNYRLTIVFSVISVLYTFINSNNCAFNFLYISFVIYFIYRGYSNNNLGSIKAQLDNISKLKFKNLYLVFFYIVYYLIIIFIILDLSKNISPFFKLVIFDYNILNYFWLVILIYLLLSQIMFVLFNISLPIIILLVFFPILLFSTIGIQNGLLNWPFIALLMGIVTNQLISPDMIFFLTQTDRKGFRNNELSEIRIKKIKYAVILYIPFLYVSLTISENLVSYDTFCYFVNLITSSHLDKQSISNSFQFLLLSGTLKIVITIIISVVFLQYKDVFLKYISKQLFLGSKRDCTLNYGKYVEIKNVLSKTFKRQWKSCDGHYFYITRHDITEWKNKKKLFSTKIPIQGFNQNIIDNKRSFKVISRDIFKLENVYYVNEESGLIKKITSSQQQEVKSILKENDHSIMWLPFYFVLLIGIFCMYLNFNMNYMGRGTYYLTYYGEKNIINKSEKIFFKDDKITIEQTRTIYYNSSQTIGNSFKKRYNYHYDKVGMFFKNSEDKYSGEFNSNPDTIVIQDLGKFKHYYIRK